MNFVRMIGECYAYVSEPLLGSWQYVELWQISLPWPAYADLKLAHYQQFRIAVAAGLQTLDIYLLDLVFYWLSTNLSSNYENF